MDEQERKRQLDELGKLIRQSHDSVISAVRQNTGKMPVVSPKPKMKRVRRLATHIYQLSEQLDDALDQLDIAITSGTPFVLGESSDEGRRRDTVDFLRFECEGDLDDKGENDTETAVEYMVKEIQQHFHGRELCRNGNDGDLILYEAPSQS